MEFPHSLSFKRSMFRSDFAPEWASVVVLIFVAAAWIVESHFELRVTWQDASVLLIVIAVYLATNWAGWRRCGLVAEYFALSAGATGVFAVLSYLALASSGPLIDPQLLAADRMMGFDWLATLHWLWARPLLSQILLLAYNSYIFQGLYFGVLFGLLERRTELREMFRLVFVAGLFTTAGALFFPALGPFKTFGLESYGAFLPDMERLHGGHHLSFALSELHGVVSFPSFHTTLALAYTYGFRRAGAVGYIIGTVNVVMLFAIPFAGGHYLSDMLGGAAVMLASLAIVRALAWRHGAMLAAEPEIRHAIGTKYYRVEQDANA